MSDAHLKLIEADTNRPVPPEVTAIAQAAKAKHPKDSITAILFYGSCFRDGQVDDGLVDLYLLSKDQSVHKSRWMRFWAQLIPPNVYYVECIFAQKTIRAKYALLPLEQFEQKLKAQVRNPYFWARFAQPTGIVEASDRPRIQQALASACTSLTNHARKLSSAKLSDHEFWTAILSQTYRTELRVEKPHRTSQIFQADAKRYQSLRQHCPQAEPNSAPWWLRRLEGRLISIARLIKASFTFQGGADYLAWKIERHSGVKIELTSWQRRHPVLASPPILWRLWRDKILSR